MTSWRLAVASVLLLLFAVPLAVPFLDLFLYPQAWEAWLETGRLFALARNTILLVAGTLALAMPCGLLGAVLLYRSDLPGRKFLRFFTVLTLFVPLPLAASAWQTALGSGGWFSLAAWSDAPRGDPDIASSGIAWKPWAHGLEAAIWVHAAAGLPWVVWLVGQGLSFVERELEEEALLSTGPWRVLWRVTLRRCRPALLAAALWVGLQTATEITVTDMMQVRTFAEEVYTQFVRPERATSPDEGRDVLARAVAVSVPGVLLTALLVLYGAGRWQRSLPPLESMSPPLCLFRLGPWRYPILAVVVLGVGVLVGVPLASLVRKAGLAGSPETWSAGQVARQVGLVLHVHGLRLTEDLGLAVVSGGLAALLALMTCWLAVESRWFLAGTLALLAFAWSIPGPVVGIGLKETINLLIGAEAAAREFFGQAGPGPLRTSLYDGPSLLPILWANLLRFFPCAVALLWPAVRSLPRELREAARVDGARPRDELLRITLPLTASVSLRAGLAVAVLSLGELSAGKLVETPGSQTFAHIIFEQMHYGVPGSVAALCLVLLAAVAVGGSLVVLSGRWTSTTRV